jgi:arylsulfatase
MTDDSGYTDLGCYGGEIDTPNIDSLAKSGVRFKNFYNNGRCSPTRASLLSGHDAGDVGFGGGTLGGHPTVRRAMGQPELFGHPNDFPYNF